MCYLFLRGDFVSFSENLKYLRIRENYTQETLSKALGISRSRLNNYEQGVREPDFETIELIADFFNVSFDFLFGRSEGFDITDEEIRLVYAFRNADDGVRLSVMKILDLPCEKREQRSSVSVS